MRGALILLLLSGAALAQVDAVDPDVKGKQLPTEEEEDTPDAEEEPAPEPVKKPEKKLEPAKKAEPAPAPAPRPAPPALTVTHLTDAELDAAWEKWRVANAANDGNAENKARAELLRLREEAGAGDLETWSAAMLRS